MAISNFGELKTAVQTWAARTDQTFVDLIPDFIALAEQRIYFGSNDAVQTGAVRVRQMEDEVELIPAESGNAMAATLPADYLAARRVYGQTDLTQELIYTSPQVFWTDIRVSPGYIGGMPYGYPMIYTIEAQQIFVSPFQAGSLKFLYYKRFPALVDDGDTNWLLQNAPGIYFQASMAEAWDYARNDARKAQSLQSYAGLTAGLNQTEQHGRRTGAPMAPQTIGSRMSDRGYRGGWR